MIASPDDYKCLDVSAFADMINGDILPARIAAGKDSSRIRIEDFLFLNEGYLQRKNWNVDVSQVSLSTSRWCKLDEMTYSVYFTSKSNFTGCKWYPADSVLKGDFVTGGPSGSGSFSSDDFIIGGSFHFEDDGLDWSYSRVFEKDVLLRRYNNMEQLSRVSCGVLWDSLIENITVTSVGVNEQGATTATSTRVVTSRFSSTNIYFCSSGSNARAVIAQKQNLLSAPWAKRAWVFVVVNIDSSSNDGYALVRLECPVVDGVIRSPDLNGVCQRAAAIFGVPYFVGPVYSSEYVRIQLQTAYLVVDNEFSAEVSSTGWRYSAGGSV